MQGMHSPWGPWSMKLGGDPIIYLRPVACRTVGLLVASMVVVWCSHMPFMTGVVFPPPTFTSIGWAIVQARLSLGSDYVT